jgi:hypothetical protein
VAASSTPTAENHMQQLVSASTGVSVPAASTPTEANLQQLFSSSTITMQCAVFIIFFLICLFFFVTSLSFAFF